jgi:hypothetical protein
MATVLEPPEEVFMVEIVWFLLQPSALQNVFCCAKTFPYITKTFNGKNKIEESNKFLKKSWQIRQ